MIETKINNFYIKYAEESDIPLILKYIRDLADYENELEQVTATEDILKQSLFINRDAEVILGVYKDAAIGFALFHKSFSTFLGKAGINLVDLYIEPELRGKGFGKAMLSFLAELTEERNLGRLEWWVHDWNEPAIGRYKKWGAVPIDNIRVYRLCEDNLQNFSSFYKKRETI